MKEIIIIGAGAAGLMAAVGAGNQAATSDANEVKIRILEKMPRPGRKIMITGKGRCNFTNLKDWNEFSQHIHPKPNFMKPSFYNLTSERMMEFLQDHGVETVVERGDRVFPASHLATDVVDALTKATEAAGAELCCGKEVTEISFGTEACGTGKRFTVRCSDSTEYECDKVIIATGGLSYPQTGSTGDGFKWAKEINHTIRPCFPSLTALVPKGYKSDGNSVEKPVLKGHINRNMPLSEIGESLCGNQLKNVGIILSIDGNVVQEEFGDLDFTDGGMEGPIGFKISRRCVNAIINGSKATVTIDLKPAVSLTGLTARINNLWDEICKDRRSQGKLYKDKFKVLLTKMMPMSLIPGFIRSNHNLDHKSLPKALKEWKIDIAGFVGYERCVITAGGVSLDEIIAKTLESRLVPGLYFAGEVLDLDADTGGYNLQIAFSTGYLSGISAAKS